MLRSSARVAIVICVLWNVSECARILSVFPIPSFSHQIVNQKLMIELSKRGHEVVVFTPNPVNDPKLKNYTEFVLHYDGNLAELLTKFGDDIWSLYYAIAIVAERICETIFTHPEMQRIIAPESNEHFDLVVVEYLALHTISALMHRFNAPLLGITSSSLSPRLHYLIGNPHAAAYTPGINDPATDDLDFWGRLNVLYRNVRTQLIDQFHATPRHEKLAKKYFGPDMPPCEHLSKEVSVVLVNEYTALGYPRPNMPNVISIGGIAVSRDLKGLESELKIFLDDAVNGFVYFSLGSNHKSKDLAADKLKALIGAFAELPYKVLWKWELDALPGKPDNVYISKWLPQNDVLSHPNIKVFFYQGGLQSTEEAINNAVPLVGSPVWFDQDFNVRKLESIHVGKKLDFERLKCKDDIVNTIMEVATDERYKERMLQLRVLINDEPMPPLERAVWWTEYVIRHNGTPHLRTSVRHMPWYQRDLCDVLLFVILVIVLICLILFKTINYIVRDILFATSRTKRKVL